MKTSIINGSEVSRLSVAIQPKLIPAFVCFCITVSPHKGVSFSVRTKRSFNDIIKCSIVNIKTSALLVYMIFV